MTNTQTQFTTLKITRSQVRPDDVLIDAAGQPYFRVTSVHQARAPHYLVFFGLHYVRFKHDFHHEQCPWAKADPQHLNSVCGCPEGWPRKGDWRDNGNSAGGHKEGVIEVRRPTRGTGDIG